MKDGVYDMTFEKYRKTPGINQSSLKLMVKSPAHFQYHIKNPTETTKQQLLGQLLHVCCLEPDRFSESFWIRPETYENKKGENKAWNLNATECRDWFEAHKDRPVLSVDESNQIIAMKKSLMENSDIREAFTAGSSEQSLFVTDPDTGLKLKCRTDRLSGNCVVDLKGTQDASPAGFARALDKFSYDAQAGMTLDICSFLGLKKDYFIFAAVEWDAPHAAAIYELGPRSIESGRGKYRRWLSLLSHCQEFNEWPSYDPAIKVIELPEYSLRREENLLVA